MQKEIVAVGHRHMATKQILVQEHEIMVLDISLRLQTHETVKKQGILSRSFDNHKGWHTILSAIMYRPRLKVKRFESF